MARGAAYHHQHTLNAITEELEKIDDPIQLAITQNLIRRHIKNKVSEGYEQKEQVLSYKIAKDAYRYILESIPDEDEDKPAKPISAKQALMHAAELHKADIEAVLAEKTRQSGKLSTSLIKDHDDNPVQKDMVKSGTFNRQALKNSNNLWQLLRTLSTFKFLYDEIKRLERKINDTSNEQKIIKADLAMAQADIVKLKEHTNMPELTDKERVRILKEMGYEQKLVAEIVGKSLSTIKRWWNT